MNVKSEIIIAVDTYTIKSLLPTTTLKSMPVRYLLNNSLEVSMPETIKCCAVVNPFMNMKILIDPFFVF
jgi:hypothetical protein